MNILTTPYCRSQLIALPMPGGKAPVEYCYAVNVPGDREVVTHDFAVWAVGDWRQQVESELCVSLTDDSKTTVASLSTSSDGNQKPSGLSTCAPVMSMANALAHAGNSREISLR